MAANGDSQKHAEVVQEVDDSKCYKKVVVFAVDGSDVGMHALDWGLTNMVGAEDRVHLLHVQSYFPVYGVTGTLPAPDLVRAQLDYEATRSMEVIEKAKHICSHLHHVKGSAEILTGDARDAICKRVEEIHPDLLILGSHGYGPLQRAFLGSVSNYLVNHAPCPVLVVRPSMSKKSAN